MTQRVLVVEKRAPILDTLQKYLEYAGFGMDVVSPSEAPARLRQDTHVFAIVRFGGSGASGTVDALKEIDHTLPVVALFAEEDEAMSGALEADSVLVEPLTGSAVVSCCRAMARVSIQARHVVDLARRISELEKTTHPPRGHAAYDYEFFKKMLLMELKRSRRHRYPVSLALVGVDRWSELAVRLDEPARAALIAGVLQVIARAIRDIDLPLLYSHDRFLVFMPHTGMEGAMEVAGRLCHRVHAHHAGRSLTVSAGVASFGGEGSISFAALARQASKALERAQAEGGDRAVRSGSVPKRNRILIG